MVSYMTYMTFYKMFIFNSVVHGLLYQSGSVMLVHMHGMLMHAITNSTHTPLYTSHHKQNKKTNTEKNGNLI